MKIIKYTINILLFLSISFVGKTQSPLFYNQGEIYIASGENVIIQGDFQNATNGQITNYGTLHVSGDWENNNSNNQVFTVNDGTVKLIGTNQAIGGSNTTRFYNLSLEGIGIKRLNIHTLIAGILHLNDRELATQNNFLTIQGADINAITRTSGFISTEANGLLIRNTNGSANWLFPMGSALHSLGYRPLIIETVGSAAGTFEVSLQNQNPTSAGYDIEEHELPICLVNHKYFFTAKRSQGSGATNLKYYYNSQNDGNFTLPTQWTANQWKVIENHNHTVNPSPDLSFFTLPNYALASPSILTFADSAPANGTPIIYEIDNVLYAGQGNTFQWYYNGNPIPNATQISYTPTAEGNYSVYVSTSGACAFMSANYYFTFTGTGIGNIDNQSFISIYPNPFINSITIDIGATSISEKLKCQLFNSTGKLVKEEMIEFNSGSQQTISVENFSSGLYFIKIFNNQLLVTKKLIKL